MDMKLTTAAVLGLLALFQFQTTWGSNINDSSVEGPICEPLPDDYAACKAITNRRSTHYYEHILPDIHNDIEGHAVDIGLAILQQFNPPPPQECTDFISHFLCLVAVPPCDPESGLPMPVCNESCVAYERLLGVDYCRDLDDYIHGVQQSSTFPDLRAVVDRYFEIDCYNTSTYIFEPTVTTFSSQSCTHLFTPNNIEQILSRPSCQQVPSGLCSSLAETGYYILVPDRNGTALLESLASVNTSLLLSCQSGLLKLACDYYYPPCHPMTFQQIPICGDSCESVALIQTSCPSMVEGGIELNIPSEVLDLDCFNPSSYLVEGVTVSQNQCIDLSTYAMNLMSQTQLDVVALAVGLSMGVASIILLSILILVGCLIWLRNRQTKEPINLARYSKRNGEASVDLHYVDTSNTESEIFKLSKADKESYSNSFGSILVSHVDIVRNECIGQGAFGKVYKGELLHSQGSGKKLVQTVAIKTIKNVSSHDELKAFFAESLIMKDFNHPNVLGLTGVCFDTPDGYPFLILPFMVNGSLKDYLKRHRVHVTDVDTYPKGLELSILLRMCMDISSGMEYLAGKKFVHRDLAARNCMVDDAIRIKVGDFGLARDVYSNDYYRATNKNAKLPVKWMSPEALHDNISNEKTDVWSFGVTCWEIFSLGRAPYPSIANHELVKLVSSGIKLEKPNLCPLQMYTVVSYCWEMLPSDRPTFSELCSQLSDCWEEQNAYL